MFYFCLIQILISDTALKLVHNKIICHNTYSSW